MHTEIYAKLDGIPPVFRAQAEERIRQSLRRWKRGLTKVRVFLRDENGPRGGLDTRCRVVLETERNGSIVTAALSSDAEGALRKALARSRTRLGRWSQRHADKARARTDRRRLPDAA